MNMHRRLQTTLLITIASLLLIALISAVNAKFIEPTNSVYGYYVDLSRLGISPTYTKVVDRNRVLIVGSIGNVSAVAVLNVSNPYEDPVVEDLYPLTGRPTYVATDGYPVTRVVVGSDKGEVLVLRIDRGRVTKHTYVVLGADFYIEKVYPAKDAYGNVRLLVLAVEGGARGYPCMNCHLYVLDEDAQGILRIGPRVGNATWWGRALEGINVQDVAPLTVYDRNGYYMDVSNVFIAYIPQLLKLVLNVSYINVTTGELKPMPNTLVEVSLAPKGVPAERVVFGVNADSRGVARIPIPIDKQRTLVVNISIRAVNGVPLWNYSLELPPKYVEQIMRISDEIPLPTVLLTVSEVDKRPATRVYGIPTFLYFKLDLYDFSGAPQAYRLKGSANFMLPPSSTDIRFLKGAGEARSKLVYIDAASSMLNIVIVSMGTTISRVTSVEDYVGSTRIVDSGTYNDGSYLLVGLNDGRVRVYVAEGQTYRLKYIYPMGSTLIDLISVPGLEGYTYIAIASSGLQVLRVEPYPLPVFRVLAQLYLSLQNYICGDALGDLSTIVLANPTSVVVLKNNDIAVKNRLTINLGSVLARDVVIKINMPGGEDVNGTKAIFRYPNGTVVYTFTSQELVLRNIIPGLVYTVDIYPLKPYIYPTSISFKLVNQTLQILSIARGSTSIERVCCTISVSMEYKEFNIRILLQDELTGSNLVAPVDIYIDGKPLALETTSVSFSVTAIYGEHNITITPSKGYENAYQPIKKTVAVSEDVQITFTLERKRYNVRIKVVDELTKAHPVAPIKVDIAGNSFVVDSTSYEYNITIPYGTYTVRLQPLQGFENVYQAKEYIVSVPQILSYVFAVSRNILRVDLTFRDPYSVNLITPVDLYINGTLAIANITETSTSFSIPYGIWIIRVVPSKGFEKVYQEVELMLNVSTNVKQEVVIPRVIYILTLNLVDIYGRVISPLNITIEGPVTVTQIVEPPGRTTQFALPYGEYAVNVQPFNTSIYLPYSTSLTMDSPKSVTLTIQRVKYRLTVNVVDRFTLIGRFELRVNGSKVADNIGARAEVELPYGVYSLQLIPLPQYEQVYQPSKALLISLTTNTSITVNVDRKIYNFRLSLMEGTTPVGNAVVDIVNEETGTFITSLPSDPTTGVVETKLPYGLYRVIVKHPQYKDKVAVIDVFKDTNQVLQLEPTVVTLLLRFLPIVGVLIAVGVGAYAIMKIRAVIAKRVVEEELF